MNTLKLFWSKYPITSHGLAVLFAMVLEAYAEVPQFHALVMQLYNAMPAHTQGIITCVIALILWYKNNRKQWTTEQRQANVAVVNAADKASDVQSKQ
jgi:hypothetical protein